MPSKTLNPLTVQLVKYHTSLPFEDVISRLEKETDKAGNTCIVQHIKRTKDQSELEALIHKNVGETGFLCVGLLTFILRDHSSAWFRSYFSETFYHQLVEKAEATTQPKLAIYVIGNPLIAQSILQNNRFAALNIPLRLLVAENLEGNGTTVAYHLPSTVMTRPDGENTLAFERQITLLNDKLEKLVFRITAD